MPELLRRGSRAVVAAQVASQIVSILTLAVLYRLLGLEPYGLMAMIIPWLALMRILLASGLDVPTVQQEELASEQVSALFWLNQLLGLGTAVLTVAVAPLIAWFYQQEKLVALTMAMSGTLLAMALSMQHLALLRRRMRLATVARIRFSALAAASVAAVIAAWAGWGVWALVTQQYVELLLLALLAWIAEPWRPSFHLIGVGVRPLALFGGHCAVANLMFYLSSQADKVLLGYFLGPEPLALYSQAFALMSRPVRVLLEPTSRVMLAALSRARVEPVRFQQWIMGFFRLLCLVTFPVGVGLAIVAPEAIMVLGGPKWAEAGPLLRLLACSVVVAGPVQSIGTVLASAGRAHILSRSSVLIAAILVSSYAVGLWIGSAVLHQPLLAVAAAYSIAILLLVFPWYMALALKSANISYWRWLGDIAPIARATAFMAVAVIAAKCFLLYVGGYSAFLLLAVEATVGVAVYLVAARKEIWAFIGQWSGSLAENVSADETAGVSSELVDDSL